MKKLLTITNKHTGQEQTYFTGDEINYDGQGVTIKDQVTGDKTFHIANIKLNIK